MEQKTKSVSKFNVRIVTEIMAGITLLLLMYGPFAVASVLGKFGSDAFLAPVRLMWQFRPLTFMVLVAGAGMLYLGLRKSSLRLLIPGAVTLIAVYWFAASIGVVMIIRGAARM